MHTHNLHLFNTCAHFRYAVTVKDDFIPRYMDFQKKHYWNPEHIAHSAVHCRRLPTAIISGNCFSTLFPLHTQVFLSLGLVIPDKMRLFFMLHTQFNTANALSLPLVVPLPGTKLPALPQMSSGSVDFLCYRYNTATHPDSSLTLSSTHRCFLPWYLSFAIFFPPWH